MNKYHMYPLTLNPFDEEDSVCEYRTVVFAVTSYEAAREWFRNNPNDLFVGVVGNTFDRSRTMLSMWRNMGRLAAPYSLLSSYIEEDRNGNLTFMRP